MARPAVFTPEEALERKRARYNRWYAANGRPDRGTPPPVPRKPKAQQLASAIADATLDACVPFPGGQMTYEGRKMQPQRAALLMAVGPPPEPEMVAVRRWELCSDKTCVNPAHLRWGTRGESRPLDPCGTYGAAKRHKRDGEDMCADCREAYNSRYRKS